MRKLSDSEKNRLDERIRLNMEEADLQTYGNQSGRRRLGKESRNTIIIIVALVILFILSVLLVVDVTSGDFSLAWVIKHFLRRCNDIIDLITGNHLQSGIHFWLTQFACPVIAGLALGASGACFQALFHNPMASPTMLGVESGGILGNLAYMLFFYSPLIASMMTVTYDEYSWEVHLLNIWDEYSQYICTFVGCILVVIIILIVARVTGKGKIQTVPLIVGGTIFTGAAESILSLVTYYESISGGDTTLLSSLQAMQAGQFTTITDPSELLIFAIPAVLPLPFLFALSGRLNVIAFGEDEARTMGINVGWERVVLILLATAMTAAVVAFCGTISFVGLMIPHIARYFVGQDLKNVLPASAFLGGIFMLLAFDVSYMTAGFVNMGLVINSVGGIVFLIFMMRNRLITGHGSFN